jgi:hypothetical protein
MAALSPTLGPEKGPSMAEVTKLSKGAEVLSTRIPSSEAKAIRALAAREDRSVAAELRRAVRAYLTAK